MLSKFSYYYRLAPLCEHLAALCQRHVRASVLHLNFNIMPLLKGIWEYPSATLALSRHLLLLDVPVAVKHGGWIRDNPMVSRMTRSLGKMA